MPTPEDIQKKTSEYIGPSYEPQTTAGKYAGSMAEGAIGSMLGPGGIMVKLLMGLGSGAGAEAGKEYMPDNPVIGSLLGGIAGGVGTAGLGHALGGVGNYSASSSAGERPW